jgi:serine/threonine protein kinase
MKRMVGTKEYFAPEIITCAKSGFKEGFNPMEVDIYSLGVTLKLVMTS